MGIPTLKKFLKDKYPHVFKNVSMFKFRGSRIAIDAGIAYNYWTIVRDRVANKITDPSKLIAIEEIRNGWLNLFWKFLSRFLRLGITPIMVFDGPPPKEKIKVNEDRYKKRTAAWDDIISFKNKMENEDILLRCTNEHLNIMKKLYKKWHYISPDDYAVLKKFCIGIGIPILQAINEAEELCSFLCKEGIVAAVYSDDVDNLAHLCPCWIYEKSVEKTYVREIDENVEFFNLIYLKDVLNSLEMSEDQFVDFCIMCGCDYNTNIPGKGPVTSFKLIKQYGTIDELPIEDISCLNHQICRKLFHTRTLKELCSEDKPNYDVDKLCYETYAETYLINCDMLYVLAEIQMIYPTLPEKIVNYTESTCHVSNEILINLLKLKLTHCQ